MTPRKFLKKLGILLIILFCSSSFLLRSSSATEVENHDSDFDSSNSDITAFPCPKKWLMVPYFENFGSLTDSSFQDFKAHELLPCSCKVPPSTASIKLKLTDVDRHLLGEGSHRRLLSSFRIDISEDYKVTPPSLACEFIIIQRLPSGIFADPFELQHLHQRGAFTDIAVFGDTNLELPSVRSNRTVVEVHMDVSQTILSKRNSGLELKIDIPLHIRYPPLDESGYSRVTFGEPDIFARCSTEGKSYNQTCIFTLPSDGGRPNCNIVSWDIPAGIEMHAATVSAVTFLSATLSAAVIIWASIQYSDVKFCKTLKQS